MYMCARERMYACGMCVYVHMYGNQKSVLNVFLSCSLNYFLRQSLSLNWRLLILARLADQ